VQFGVIFKLLVSETIFKSLLINKFNIQIKTALLETSYSKMKPSLTNYSSSYRQTTKTYQN